MTKTKYNKIDKYDVWTIQCEIHPNYTFYSILDSQMCDVGFGGFTPEEAWDSAQEDSKIQIPTLENMTKDTINF